MDTEKGFVLIFLLIVTIITVVVCEIAIWLVKHPKCPKCGKRAILAFSNDDKIGLPYCAKCVQFHYRLERE